MPKAYANRVWMTTATSGTGTITLGSAVAGYMTFAEGGVANSDTVTYVLVDGNDFEVGTGTYTTSGTTMSRDTVIVSKISGTAGTTKLTLSGSAEVFLSASKADIAFVDVANTFTQTQTVSSTDAGATGGPTFDLYRDSASPAASDYIGEFNFSGRDSTAVKTIYGQIRGQIVDPTNATEDGAFMFRVMYGGTLSDVLYFGSATMDYSTPSPAAVGPAFYLSRYTNLADGNTVGEFYFGGNSDTGNYRNFVMLRGVAADATNATEDGQLLLRLIEAGTERTQAHLEVNGRLQLMSNAGANVGTVSAYHWTHLTADYTLTSAGTEQKAFNNPTNGTLTLAAGVYKFQAWLYLTTMNAASGNLAFDPVGAGTATTDRWGQHAIGIDNTSPLNAGTQTGSGAVTQQTVASAVTAGAGTGMILSVNGMFRVSTGGTIIPSVTLVTANAAVVKAGSYFQCAKIGESTESYVGAWT